MDKAISTLINPKESDQGGDIARAGFHSQDLFLINELIRFIRDSNFLSAYSEHHEDYILIWKNKIKICQVKTVQDDSESWSLDKRFATDVLSNFIETKKNINSDGEIKFYFITNSNPKKTLTTFFKILKKDKKEETDLKKIDEYLSKVINWLKIDSSEEHIVRFIIDNLRFQKKENRESIELSNKAIIQEILKPAEININIATKIHDKFIALVSNISAGSKQIEISGILDIFHDESLSEEEQDNKLKQIKKCITRKDIIDCIDVEGSPLDSEIIYKTPEEHLKFQRMMLKAGINKKVVDQAGVEFFNIEYHRKKIGGILGNLGDKYLDGSKAAISSKWATIHSNNYSTEEKLFGNKVYSETRLEIQTAIKDREITNPVLNKEIHGFGLLHELAEEEKITYEK